MLRQSQEPPMLPPGVSRTSDLAGKWWVAHTKSRFEKAFARDLLDRGIGYFLPLVRRTRMRGRRKVRVLLPLFPSYVFFCGDEDSRAAAMSTDRLCTTLDVPDQQQLRSECAAIEQALAGGAQLSPCRRLDVGRRCRVTGGAFRGIEGTVTRRDGRPRIALEISTLGLGASLEIEADLLEPVAGDGSR